MAAAEQKPELIVIVGPTASGKSELALMVAKQFGGEIIAADSRTIYKGMDIGTAKPSPNDQKSVPHWGVDLVEPGGVFNAHKFKEYAGEKIADIHQRGNLPILVGGTGLYIDSVVFDFKFGKQANSAKRQELEELTLKQLQQIIKDEGYEMPKNFQNMRHLVRTIERQGKTGSRNQKLAKDILLIGLLPDTDELRNRIKRRTEQYFENGLIDETTKLLEEYSEDILLKTHGIAYKACIDLINNKISLDEAKKMIQGMEWQYARRQRTWFRRNKFIRWFDTPDRAYKEIKNSLNN